MTNTNEIISVPGGIEKILQNKGEGKFSISFCTVTIFPKNKRLEKLLGFKARCVHVVNLLSVQLRYRTGYLPFSLHAITKRINLLQRIFFSLLGFRS